MKRSGFIIMLFMLTFSVGAYSQTYYYKFTQKIDSETGVRESHNKNVYVTFTPNKVRCYQSDQNGNQTSKYTNEVFLGPALPNGPFTSISCDNIFIYQSHINGMYTYACEYTYSSQSWSPFKDSGKGVYYLTFSDDYKRVNFKNGKTVYVGERATPPGKEAPPSQMW